MFGLSGATRDGGEPILEPTSVADRSEPALQPRGYRRRPPAAYTGTRPPKNGISARLSVCGRLDVNMISAPA